MPDFNLWINNTKNKLTMNGGPIDEGSDDNRNGLGTGSVYDWNTYPSEVYVTPDAGAQHRGEIAVHFSGRERKADYVLGAQRDTNDTQSSGRVTARYSFDFDGKVYFTAITKHGGLGRVGNAVVGHVQSVNGQSVA